MRIFLFERPNLVVSDQVMQGMTGLQLAQAIKRVDPAMPVIIITGLNDIPVDAAIADLLMSKLEGPAKLLRNIETVLNRGCQSSDNRDTGSFHKLGPS